MRSKEFSRRTLLVGGICCAWHASLLDAADGASAESTARQLGCLSYATADGKVSCAPAWLAEIVSLGRAIPNSAIRSNFELGVSDILDTGERLTGIRANVQIYKDGMSPNAMASLEVSGPVRGGSILIGWGKLGELLSKKNSTLLCSGIIAHEFAHVVQMASGICSDLLCGERVLNIELHADYMAGFLLQRSRSGFQLVDVKVLAEGWREAGSKGGFSDCNFHGTSEQRLLCLEEGFKAGSALEVGYDAVAEQAASFLADQNMCDLGRCE